MLEDVSLWEKIEFFSDFFQCEKGSSRQGSRNKDTHVFQAFVFCVDGGDGVG